MLSACLILCAVYSLLLLLKFALAMRAARAQTPLATSTRASTTILQPILSGDPALAEVLATNLRALPHCRFLWLLDEDDAVAQATTARLRAAHPDVAIDCLVLPPAPDGHNPKMHKLALATAQVQTPHLLVLDDDTTLPAASLAELLAELDRCDLATGLPCYLDDGRFASRLLAQFVNNNAALTYLPLLNVWPPPSINGMCYALRVEALARMGGFAPLATQLADDLAVATRLRAAGGRIHQSIAPQFVRTSVRDLRHYAQVMHRWFLFALLLLKNQSWALRASILVLHGLPPLLLLGAVITAVLAGHIVAVAALAVMLALRSGLLCTIQRRLSGQPRHAFGLSLLAELAQPLHAVHALLHRRIHWRTRHYLVRANDDFGPA